MPRLKINLSDYIDVPSKRHARTEDDLVKEDDMSTSKHVFKTKKRVLHQSSWLVRRGAHKHRSIICCSWSLFILFHLFYFRSKEVDSMFEDYFITYGCSLLRFLLKSRINMSNMVQIHPDSDQHSKED